jgi:hypothetical protein
MHHWHKELLHEAVPPLIRKWEPKLGVQVHGYFLQRMKTKWGGCNHRAGHTMPREAPASPGRRVMLVLPRISNLLEAMLASDPTLVHVP